MWMIYLYNTLAKQGMSDYQIKRLVERKELYMIKKGVYSTTEEYNYFDYIARKHPNAIITLETACYCYGLLKEFPKRYYVATKQKDRKMKEAEIKQIFMSDSLYPIGISHITFQGVRIQIYDLERLLIEVVRNKMSISYDVYQEIIDSYRRILRLLNKKKLQEYLPSFKDPRIVDRIEREVYQKKD